MAERTKVFIAYCFPEKRWLDRVQAALEPFAGADRCVVWDERKVRASGTWKTELPAVLATTKVAMMIVSDLFLESDFITRVKLPAILEREREDGLEICWVLAGQCLFELAGLKESDLGNRAGSAFDGLGLAQRDAEVAAISKKVAGLLGVEAPLPTDAPPPPKKPLLPSAIPQVVAPKPVPKKRRNFGTKKGEVEPLPQPSLLPVAPPVIVPPQELLPAPIPKTAASSPPAAKAQEPAPQAEPVPAPAEILPPGAARALSLTTMIEARQTTVLKLSRLGRWILFFAYAIALIAVGVLFTFSIEHFVFVAGFAMLAAGLAMWLTARSRDLGQGLVAMRYTSSGLADEALPTRQRDALVRKADEYLAQN